MKRRPARTHRRVFRGWFSPRWDLLEYIEHVRLTLWRTRNGATGRCKITVEWSETK